MAANRSRMRWTWEEYMRLPMSGSTRYEVVANELAVTPSSSGMHQLVLTNLVLVLGTFARDHDLGRLFPVPIDVLFGEGDYVQPDLVFLRPDRAHLLTPRGIEGPPDLVVEILSPSTAQRDRGVKLERYRHFGVPEYWIVDIDAQVVEAWRLAEGAVEPQIVGAEAHVRWAPLPEGPSLAVAVADILS